jgi:soluble lytic murein transglycosylase-like protein
MQLLRKEVIREVETFDQVAARVEAWTVSIAQAPPPQPVPVALVRAVIHEESGGDPDAFPEHPERDGASFGLMQLLLPTARAVGYSGKARLLFEPHTNVALGIRYLAGLKKEHGTWHLALIAYNGGPKAAWLAAHHLPCGPAGHYADTVLALWGRYELRLQARAAHAG